MERADPAPLDRRGRQLAVQRRSPRTLHTGPLAGWECLGAAGRSRNLAREVGREHAAEGPPAHCQRVALPT
eukprot:2457214-Alexandrium_andersonii.AAC.1